MKQQTEEWHEARLGNLGGSNAAAVMGTPAASRRYLIEKAVEIATGEYKEIHSKYMNFGIANEAAGVAAYSLETGLTVEHVGIVQYQLSDRITCSPDGLVTDDDETRTKGVIEVKSRFDVSKHVGTIFDNEVPKEYLWQCQWNIWVTETMFCDYVSYCPAMPPNSRLHIVRVWRKPTDVNKMIEKTTTFLKELDTLVERLL